MTINALIFKSSVSSGMYSLGSSWHHSLRASSARAPGQQQLGVGEERYDALSSDL